MEMTMSLEVAQGVGEGEERCEDLSLHPLVVAAMEAAKAYGESFESVLAAKWSEALKIRFREAEREIKRELEKELGKEIPESDPGGDWWKDEEHPYLVWRKVVEYAFES